jgi:hypothetical protein
VAVGSGAAVIDADGDAGVAEGLTVGLGEVAGPPEQPTNIAAVKSAPGARRRYAKTPRG